MSTLPNPYGIGFVSVVLSTFLRPVELDEKPRVQGGAGIGGTQVDTAGKIGGGKQMFLKDGRKDV